MKILGLILARAGSKRLKNKNIINLGKKKLIEHTIDFIKKIPNIHICVSTDSKKIAKVAIKNNIIVPWLRPKKYSKDNSSSAAAALHALKCYEKKYGKFDAIALFQPTTPFRNFNVIKKTLDDFKKDKNKNYVSVSEANVNLNNIFINKNNKTKKIKLKKPNSFIKSYKNKLYRLNGSFYIISPNEFKRTKSFITENSIGVILKNKKEQIDIDTISDLKNARSYL